MWLGIVDSITSFVYSLAKKFIRHACDVESVVDEVACQCPKRLQLRGLNPLWVDRDDRVQLKK